MSRIHGIWYALLVFGVAGALCPAGDCKINDDEENSGYDAGGITIRVYYDEGDCSTVDDWPGNYADTMVQETAGALDGYRALGFADPIQEGLPEYKIVADPTDKGNAHASITCTTYGTDMLNNGTMACTLDPVFMRMVSGHEMFHHIQYRYFGDPLGGLGDWVIEGTARYMQDKVFTDLDASNYSFAGFVDETQGTIASPGTSLLDLSYKACLFWTYAGEQLAGPQTEPEYGYEFTKTFFDEFVEDAAFGDLSALWALDDAIDVYDPDQYLNKLWLDYAIANYAKDFDLFNFPGGYRYGYIDENQYSEGGWGQVPRDIVVIPTIGPISGNVGPYATYYVDGNVGPADCEVIGFRGEAPFNMGWAVIGIDENDQVVDISKGLGQSFGRSFINTPNRPLKRLVGIVAGIDINSDFEYWFSLGFPDLEIYRPDVDHPAYVNVNDTFRPFLIRVIVDGPDDLKPEGVGERSIMGLQLEDFTVEVDGQPCNIVGANYVGQYYWLVAEAPSSLPIGLYDLTVGLCDGELQQTNQDAVNVTDAILHHMLVVDNSGSMGDPDSSPKLAAAKIAAELYTNAVSYQDFIGLVNFNGNNVACDDDATLQQGLALATTAHREDVIADLKALTAGGWTSIGDGLWKAWGHLTTNATNDEDMHFIVALSDGMENESRFWDVTASGCTSAESLIVPTKTIIHSFAFGPQADQGMMQDIATQTGGDYDYIDVTATESVGGGALSMANELAEAYINALQSARDLERLFFQSGAMSGAGTTIEIPITEDDLEEVVFFFNTSDAGDELQVTLLDPFGQPVPPAVALAETGDTNAVYHFLVSPTVGTWTAELGVQDDTDYIAGVLGRNPHTARMEVEIAGIPAGSDFTVLCGYEPTLVFEPLVTLTETLGEPPPTTYLDETAGQGLTFHYRVRAEAFDGGLSRYSRIVTGTHIPDCNGNGIDDATDIASGDSADCNVNGVPDECEEGDFDGDGLIDLYEHARFVETCMTGPEDEPLSGCCTQLDFNSDSDVDMRDFRTFQQVFGTEP